MMGTCLLKPSKDKNIPSNEYFHSSYKVTEAGCWEWQRYIAPNGYSKMRRDGHYYAHRWSYSFFKGPIKPYLEINHLCFNRKCVNPDHLEQVSGSQNQKHALMMRGRKDHCKRGHNYNETGFRLSRGKRECLVCYNYREALHSVMRRSKI